MAPVIDGGRIGVPCTPATRGMNAWPCLYLPFAVKVKTLDSRKIDSVGFVICHHAACKAFRTALGAWSMASRCARVGPSGWRKRRGRSVMPALALAATAQ